MTVTPLYSINYLFISEIVEQSSQFNEQPPVVDPGFQKGGSTPTLMHSQGLDSWAQQFS